MAAHEHPVVIVPGIYDSGPEHWQSRWQTEFADARRIEPASFDRPVLADWIHALDAAIATCTTPPVLIAHSLGCLATLAWAARRPVPEQATAIMLVAVPDPGSAPFPAAASSVTDVRPAPLAVPSLVVASTDDPYGSLDYATGVAAASGAELHIVGALGHINADSGLGDWPQGRRLLAELLAPGHEAAEPPDC